jgi:hypothetical protein
LHEAVAERLDQVFAEEVHLGNCTVRASLSGSSACTQWPPR